LPLNFRTKILAGCATSEEPCRRGSRVGEHLNTYYKHRYDLDLKKKIKTGDSKD
jgi:hypothetical protein